MLLISTNWDDKTLTKEFCIYNLFILENTKWYSLCSKDLVHSNNFKDVEIIIS